jgi:hypothetical protein
MDNDMAGDDAVQLAALADDQAAGGIEALAFAGDGRFVTGDLHDHGFAHEGIVLGIFADENGKGLFHAAADLVMQLGR